MNKKIIRIDSRENGRLWIAMAPDKDWLQRIRIIQGRQWHPDDRRWSVPADEESIRSFIEHFHEMPVHVP